MPFIPDFLSPHENKMMRVASEEYLPEDANRALRPEEREALVAFHGAKEKHHRETGRANLQDPEFSGAHHVAAEAHAEANPSSRSFGFGRGLQEQQQATQTAIDASAKADAMKPRSLAPSPDWIASLSAQQPGE